MSANAAPARHSASMAGGSPTWRLAAIGLFLGAPLLLLGLAISNIADGSEASQAALRAEDTARTIVHQIERSRGRPKSGPDLSSIYLASPDVSLARAELQTLTARMIESASAHLVETQTDPDDQNDPGRVALRLTLDATNAQLLDLLYAVETDLPLLTITGLNARASGEGDTKPEVGGTLRVEMTVRAAWKARPE